MSRIDLTHIRAVLFDLDGTLLQVEMNDFIPRYITGLSACFSDLVSPKKFKMKFLGGIRELILRPSDGTTNEERLLAVLERDLDLSAQEFHLRLDAFREQGTAALADMVTAIPHAAEVVEFCRTQGQIVVLATNPVFPRFMVDARRDWSGLGNVHFDHVTSYENSSYCKPNPSYFEEVAEQIGVLPSQCLMVGNDSSHDLAAMGAGMTTFLVDTFLVERPGRRWPSDYRGNHAELLSFLREYLPNSSAA